MSIILCLKNWTYHLIFEGISIYKKLREHNFLCAYRYMYVHVNMVERWIRASNREAGARINVSRGI